MYSLQSSLVLPVGNRVVFSDITMAWFCDVNFAYQIYLYINN